MIISLPVPVVECLYRQQLHVVNCNPLLTGRVLDQLIMWSEFLMKFIMLDNDIIENDMKYITSRYKAAILQAVLL